jgi:hypothetical protein
MGRQGSNWRGRKQTRGGGRRCDDNRSEHAARGKADRGGSKSNPTVHTLFALDTWLGGFKFVDTLSRLIRY